MKTYEVQIPVGYYIYKTISAESLSAAITLGRESAEQTFDSWEDDGGETVVLYNLATAEEINDDAT